MKADTINPFIKTVTDILLTDNDNADRIPVD